jgi:hypothetical protein
MKRPTEAHCRIIAAMQERDRFTTAEIAEECKASLNTVLRVIRLLDDIDAIEKIDRHPAPLFKFQSEQFKSASSVYFVELRKLNTTAPSESKNQDSQWDDYQARQEKTAQRVYDGQTARAQPKKCSVR